VELPATMGDAIQGLLETAPAAGWLQWANATADAPLPGASEVLPAVKDVGGDERTADDSLDGGDEMLSPNSAPLLSRAHAPVGPGGEPAVVSTTALSEEDLASKPLAEAQAGTAAAETRPETEDEVMRASVTDSAAAAASRPRVTFQDEVAEVEPRNVVVEAPASPGQVCPPPRGVSSQRRRSRKQAADGRSRDRRRARALGDYPVPKQPAFTLSLERANLVRGA